MPPSTTRAPPFASRSLAPILSVPALTVVAPVEGLSPPSTKVPVPTFVSAIARRRSRRRSSASRCRRCACRRVSVRAPPTVDIPVPTRAPAPPTPLPPRLIASPATLALLISRVAPLPMLVSLPAPAAPSADAFAATRVPPVTVVAPVYVLAALSVTVPAPLFVRCPRCRRAPRSRLPDCTSNAVALFSVPLTMLPLASWTPLTVSVSVPRSSVPPLTTSVPAFLSRSFAPASCSDAGGDGRHAGVGVVAAERDGAGAGLREARRCRRARRSRCRPGRRTWSRSSACH